MKINKIFSTFFGLLFLVAILLSAINFVVFQRSFYAYEYSKGNQVEDTGMSEEDLMRATDTLLDYVRDDRDDIVVEASVNGEVREVFDERETLHMVDVKNLYLNAMKVRNILFIISIAGLVLLPFIFKIDFIDICKDAFYGGLIFLIALVLFVGIWAVVDFNGFWMQFHYIFFDNDLFLLDPNVSIMINMFPSNFFFEMVFCIIIVFVVLLLVIYLLIKGQYRLKEVRNA